MKRLHIHVGVKDLADSVRFYNALFGAEPVKLKSDYAKWMLDDPRVNFAISTRADKIGVDHMGIQVDNADELGVLREHMSQANISTHSDGETTWFITALTLLRHLSPAAPLKWSKARVALRRRS
jgi:catechol 2,3-dioxygenase-like lactoylglutathione lyase family enzyme